MVEKKTEELIVAEYKLHIHCKECASAVHKHIVQNSGVEKVDINVESGKVIVKGYFDVKKVQERIEKKTKKKVELISSKFLPKEEKKEEEIKIIVIKVHLHCENCEQDLKILLLKHKEIHKVETNLGDNSCKIIGVIKEKELVEYIQKKTNKIAKILKVEAKIEIKKAEEKKDEKEKLKAKKAEFLKKIKLEIEKKKQELKEKDIEIEIDELFRKISVEKEEKKKELKVKELEIEMEELFKKIEVEMEKKDFLLEKDVDIEELFKKMKVKIEEKKWELKEKYFATPHYHLHHAHAHAPCYIHSPPCYIQKPPYYSQYAHAPQWFSDEDPNACVVM
ncbi:heavy metal-associated isoprenylated plant protein 4-like [Zingiber officinale]|uniref:heavy metal-associated isoprenylated plant protein 4-like n=1 Tax=Zingiber officinale TaxID=94328 RepID=UPI001C4B7695|nr:heavy metal-associated isoprenylated plant protein 4-like [Zingiber officinale]